MVKIVKRKSLGIQSVYDIGVKRDHNFLLESRLIASNCFEKSHATAYAEITYQSAYLKANYPTEYMAALLTAHSENQDRLKMYIANCFEMGIDVEPPDINKSNIDFTPNGSKILFGWFAISQLEWDAIESILVARKNNTGQFKSFSDFCRKVDLHKINRNTLEILIHCGAFDKINNNRNQLVHYLDSVINWAQQWKEALHRDRMNLLDMQREINEDDEITKKIYSAPSLPNVSDFSLQEKREQEKSILGICFSSYSIESLLKNLNISDKKVKQYLKLLERKKQIIFQGSPGTGKTFLAENLARYLASKTEGFSEIVQFHPAYSYEDFIQGIRPQTNENGQLTYPIIDGRFVEFCNKAREYKGICVLIIDEINRANLAQVFGELMYLLEYRDRTIKLAVSGDEFQIPKNVRIIGTMNTADRSIALVDHALRRRFAFITLRPDYNILRTYHQNSDFPIENLITILENLNHAIAAPHYEIGISFFLQENLSTEIADIWQMEIEPYLEEYFFDDVTKIETFRWDTLKTQIFPQNAETENH